MSQVLLSRPPSQLSGHMQKFGHGMPGPVLPEIQHPLSRMTNPGDLDVRGMSRAGSRPATSESIIHIKDQIPSYRCQAPPSRSGRPLANETKYTTPSRLHTSGGRSISGPGSGKKQKLAPIVYESIPEGVEVAHGDPNKTKIPIFGNRTGLEGRPELESRMSGRMSRASTQARIEIDEMEVNLKQKIKSNFYEIKKKFKDNDPEGKGNVTRDAMSRILVTLLNRPLNQSSFSRLMQRLGFERREVINYTEFFSHFRDVSDGEYPRWMDPVHRHWQDKVIMNAAQVHGNLKQRARQRFLDIADLIPQLNPDGSGHIERAEMRNALNRMNFYMDDEEFKKLWDKYDHECTGTINGERFLNALGISLCKTADGRIRQEPPTSAPPPPPPATGQISDRTPRKREIERKQSLNVERWLKAKFREGFKSMKNAFEEKDSNQFGIVAHDAFLKVLADNGLALERNLLAPFLNRCGIQVRKDGVQYREFLHRFQDRGEDGMTHKILANPQHDYNRVVSAAKSTLGALESQILNMFQRDFLALLGFFKKIDKFGTGVISPEEFRAAMESRFNIELTDNQFTSLLDKLPLDEEGSVRYREFMRQFDTKGVAPSLFQDPEKMDIPDDEVMRSSPQPGGREDTDVDRLVVVHDAIMEDIEGKRPAQELFRIIKALLYKKYQEVEEAYYDMDVKNTKRLSQEDMFQLLRKFNIKPEVTRGEIRDLWKTFITNTDKTLDYQQFVRHFGYSLRSAAFPNSKVSPPKRGDADYMLRSRKLNCAADMLQDSLRAKIDYMWEDLRREFVNMDPYATGFVTGEEFVEVLSELCVHLSPYELQMLASKFDIKNNGRVSYLEFLKPFALRKQIWRHGNDLLSLLQHPMSELPIDNVVQPPQKGLHGITARLRQKLSGEWKNLRRAFRKLDTANDGYLSVPEFRSVLKLANILLDEDEVYHVMNQFDEDMTGKIPYERFISEIFKPGTGHIRKLPIC